MATPSRPAVNRDGDWIVYRARTGAVEEHPPEDARRLLDAGDYVIRPGARAGEWDAGPTWTLDMGPEAYLERYPDGPNADLAREVLGVPETAATPDEQATGEDAGGG